MTTPEFSRPCRLDRIGAGESTETVEATPEERAALARRFGLAALDRLTAEFQVRRQDEGVAARGHLRASLAQRCVVTGDPVPATIEERFDLRFLPAPEDGDPDAEIELSEDECDTMFFTGAAIDLGEAAAETMALALDPYPRSEGAAEALKEAGVLSEEEAGPFGALAELKDKLSGKK
ncbi:YceD family protein [Stakelama tenebrarum]|uniref:DUF177 domain-containing protein n=1 Tax=Stakelama tenebrarum TaxID=2711215 RepID=A0A6G6Y2G8_9SPHN|nr:DUF177 domain-containing protein [Sphingosinithalassobacter tenebrarum]QIG78803.1 DUF177 domain-containing protein [Sphingosinithalassobacter tenebrarum]